MRMRIMVGIKKIADLIDHVSGMLWQVGQLFSGRVKLKSVFLTKTFPEIRTSIAEEILSALPECLRGTRICIQQCISIAIMIEGSGCSESADDPPSLWKGILSAGVTCSFSFSSLLDSIMVLSRCSYSL